MMHFRPLCCFSFFSSLGEGEAHRFTRLKSHLNQENPTVPFISMDVSLPWPKPNKHGAVWYIQTLLWGLHKVAVSWCQINGVSEPPWSPIDSNKTKQSSEESNTAGFINRLRKEFQPPDLRDVQFLPNTTTDYTCNNGFTMN